MHKTYYDINKTTAGESFIHLTLWQA